jgi:hypothetical protein
VQSVGTRWIIAASLLRGSWCRGCLLPDVDVDLTGISRWLACNRGRNGELLLSSDSSGSIGVFTLFRCLSVYPSCGGMSAETTKIWRSGVSKSSPG